MPYYFIYKITQGSSEIVKNLEKIDRYDNFKSAKQQAKQLRIEQASDDKSIYKIIFAESELQAEEMLMEKREAPVMLEWEK